MVASIQGWGSTVGGLTGLAHRSRHRGRGGDALDRPGADTGANTSSEAHCTYGAWGERPKPVGALTPVGHSHVLPSYDDRVSDVDPYRRLAGLYDLVVEPMQTGVRRVALRVVPPSPSWRVLDVGCGTGTGMLAYLEAGCSVSGVDVSEAMLEKAEARIGDRGELRLGDGSTLPYPEGHFDLVTTSMVLHEVPAGEREAFVAEMARVAKPEGRLLITDFRFGSLRGLKGRMMRRVSAMIERFSGHYSGYLSFKAGGGVSKVVASAGLSIERTKIVGGGNLAIWVIRPGANRQRALEEDEPSTT
jgi:ubiquinone/menaquinone biosynthesis C-methylase UbiE